MLRSSYAAFFLAALCILSFSSANAQTADTCQGLCGPTEICFNSSCYPVDPPFCGSIQCGIAQVCKDGKCIKYVPKEIHLLFSSLTETLHSDLCAVIRCMSPYVCRDGGCFMQNSTATTTTTTTGPTGASQPSSSTAASRTPSSTAGSSTGGSVSVSVDAGWGLVLSFVVCAIVTVFSSIA
ncbi:hypothetical protein BJ742DRAFT_807940 [Cladochytrium replicatum]|nr:hypothetical protein BJ742DRAFT_807940 [Cladochytrium replicatum]